MFGAAVLAGMVDVWFCAAAAPETAAITITVAMENLSYIGRELRAFLLIGSTASTGKKSIKEM
jgi:hypothetical protein